MLKEKVSGEVSLAEDSFVRQWGSSQMDMRGCCNAGVGSCQHCESQKDFLETFVV